MSTTVMVNGFYAQGTSIRVTGNKRSQPAVTGASITVIVQQAADADGHVVQGTATLKGVNISTGITNWELVVPSNQHAGTFVPGRGMFFNVTTADASGNQIEAREGTWEVEGGPSRTFDMGDFVEIKERPGA
jgi:hypothetical protein